MSLKDIQIKVTSEPTTDRSRLKEGYSAVRLVSEQLCTPLSVEDYVIQSMTDVSPTRWHIAHTTWFFETFILKIFKKDHQLFHEKFQYLFNSYYNTIGDQHCRDRRGILSRPTVDEIYNYRRYVDEAMLELLDSCDEATLLKIVPLLYVGQNHEQQHQELMLMDIKHVFFSNPLKPRYLEIKEQAGITLEPVHWHSLEAGLYHIGFDGEGFSYDNEGPRHKIYLEDVKIAHRLVTNGEYLEFINDNGYNRAELWLSDGWSTIQKEQWQAPLYWEQRDQQWWIMTLGGMRPLNLNEPVCHVSYYEADAFARWAGKRLPTEAEWEVASQDQKIAGNFVEEQYYHPQPLASNDSNLQQMFGDVWEWTSSPYSPYPGYKPPEGALGEYNGKFMCNQMVLRGGACATSQTHIRSTYRNFFVPQSRWPFTGVRLAD